MPYVQSDGARLYYEEAGTGTPIVFVHEFSGDIWSWEKQIQHFSRRSRACFFAIQARTVGLDIRHVELLEGSA